MGAALTRAAIRPAGGRRRVFVSSTILRARSAVTACLLLVLPAAPPSAQDAPAQAMSVADRLRHTAGGQVYAAYCQSCHQEHGWGVEAVAPSLVESPLVLGSPELGIRIVLHGKTGSFGAMSPLARAMKDEQIADVLTFIRREWGNNASAVTPALVTLVREREAARTRPWTATELSAISPGKP